MPNSIDPIYHRFSKWEEHHAGMWKTFHGKKRKEYLQKAIEFTGNARLYGEWMLKVLDEWPISCEQNLSKNDINRRAWIGHAACCLALGCPGDITREAWHFLSQQQKDDANTRASKAIASWENTRTKENKQLRLF